MRKRWKYMLFLLLLLLLDQGVKLAIHRFYTPDGDLMRTVGVHLHPEVNGKSLLLAEERAAQTGLPAPFWMAVSLAGKCGLMLLSLAFVGVGYVALTSANLRAYPRLAGCISALTCAGTLCSIIDDLSRGGSLDWFCVSRSIHLGEQRHDIAHFIFDLKDFYVFLAVIATILFFLLACAGMIRFGRDKEAEAAWKKAFPARLMDFARHPIRTLTGGMS